mgnify:CR=1 FL=1
MTHADLDALDDFLDKKDEEPFTNGSLSVVVPMDDFKLILRQMWKSRATEPKMGELYEKYTKLTTFEE